MTDEPEAAAPNSAAQISVSVIIPAYNAARTLPHCLVALSTQEYPRNCYEVIVVDDGSTDDTAAIAGRAGAQVITQPNRGPAAARNSGAAIANGELLLFTDADCVPVAGWIRELTAPFVDRTVAGAKGTYLTRQRTPVPRFTQLEYADRYDRMARADTIDFVDTYSAAYRRTVFLENGGFDTIFPTASVEDQEFSFRLAEKGYRLVFAPRAQVYHWHNPTLAAYSRRKFLIGYWKALLTRWHPGRLVSDSHTPQVLKIQMGLVALVLCALGLGLLGGLVGHPWGSTAMKAAGALGTATAAAFLFSSLPFLAKAWQRDRGVLLPALGLLWVRAAALGLGFAVGLARFRGEPGERRPILTVWQRIAKRGMDLAGALLGLLLAAVPMGLIALAVKLDTPGPILCRPMRVGQDGRPFRLLKFRTAAEPLPPVVSQEAPAQGEAPDATRTGRWLRRHRLDDLPLLVNVLVGKMSLVGPQPEEMAVVAHYSDAQRRRLAVKPGIVGHTQINGERLSFAQRLDLDLDYVARFSLRGDLAILWRAVLAAIPKA